LRKWYIIKKLNTLLASKKTPFHLLDAGCGEGQYLFPFTEKRRQSYFKGIDREKSNIHFCNRYALHKNYNHVLFEVMEMEEMEEKNTYDIVLCISVLPYCKNDATSLTSVYHAMKTGGELFLYVPVNNNTVLPFYREILQRFDNYETIQQNQRVYTEQLLLKLLKDAGFMIIETKKTYGFFGKLSNELLNTHFILFNAYSFFIKILIAISLLLFYPLILTCMVLDFILPVKTGNGLMLLAKKTG